MVLLHFEEQREFIDVDSLAGEPLPEGLREDVVLFVRSLSKGLCLSQQVLLTGEQLQRWWWSPRDDENRSRVLGEFLSASPIPLHAQPSAWQSECSSSCEDHLPCREVIQHLPAGVHPTPSLPTESQQAVVFLAQLREGSRASCYLTPFFQVLLRA
nr:hypothetical protein [Hyalangium versicolor]